MIVHYSAHYQDPKGFLKPLDWKYSYGKEKFEVTVGVGEVIRAWDYALPRMSLGSRTRVICSPPTAYGDHPVGSVPPRSIVHFTIDLLEILRQ